MCAPMRPLITPRKCPQRFPLPLTLSSQRALSLGLPLDSSMKRSHLELMQLAILEQMLMLSIINNRSDVSFQHSTCICCFKAPAAAPVVSAAGLSCA